jgi:hypothetical protein
LEEPAPENDAKRGSKNLLAEELVEGSYINEEAPGCI